MHVLALAIEMEELPGRILAGGRGKGAGEADDVAIPAFNSNVAVKPAHSRNLGVDIEKSRPIARTCVRVTGNANGLLLVSQKKLGKRRSVRWTEVAIPIMLLPRRWEDVPFRKRKRISQLVTATSAGKR